MLIPCVQCGKREYTEESPLWHLCDKCLHEKPEKKYRCAICGSQYDIKKTDFIQLCPTCSKTYAKAFVDSFAYCDRCDGEFNITHLFYDSRHDLNLCGRCFDLVGDE